MKAAAGIVAGLALFAIGGRAEATPVLTTNPALLSLPGVTMIDFEDLTVPSLITTQYAAEGIVFSGGLHTDTLTPSLVSGGLFGAIAAGNGDPGCCPDITMSFLGPVSRLGFDIITRNNAVTTLEVYTGSGSSLNLLGTLTLNATLEPQFFGIAADPFDPKAYFDRVVISTALQQNPSAFVIDNIGFTAPVPEPSSVTLVGIGAAALVRRLRRGRAAQPSSPKPNL
jgi:hypothetical protein